MPTYNVVNKKTGKVSTKFMTWVEFNDFLKANPDYEQVPAAPLIHSGIGLKKPDDSFRDILRRIKKSHLGANVNTF